MGTTTVVKINNPKMCGSCGSDQLKYTTEDYGGIRDTFWECSCGWEDIGATFSVRKNTKVDYFPLEGLERTSGVKHMRGPDKKQRNGRTDKGKKRGPNKRTLIKIAAQKGGK